MRVLTVALATSAVIVLNACASTPPPKEQMAVAEAAVKHATTTSTNENAAGELQLATDKLTSARDAMNRQDYETAKRLAEQTEVDAQVAELHAQTARSRKAAVETENAAGVLNTEMNRNVPK
jgi:hypothetical protein